MTAKEKLRHLVDRMSEQEAERTLGLVEGAKGPLIRALNEAPLDDEPTTRDEDEGAAEALAEYERGESHSADDISASSVERSWRYELLRERGAGLRRLHPPPPTDPGWPPALAGSPIIRSDPRRSSYSSP